MLAPQTMVDRYTVEALLGEGGMAVVYKVRHTRLGTHHAMKVLKIPHASIQDRMLREGQVQARLRHPNIVSVTDIVDVDGAPGLVMEYVEGSDLHELVYDRRLSLDQVDAIATGIIEGVAAAHVLGLVHRDLKPANILLAPEGRTLVPKITDFGLAKVLTSGAGDRGQTRTGISMGTPSYMAPEQIRNARDVDARADIFSIGAILYELLAGRRAYDSDDLLEVFNAVAKGTRVPIEELRPDAPPRMIQSVKRCLEVDRTKRPQTCEELLELWRADQVQDEFLPFDSELFERVKTLGSGSHLRPAQPETYAEPNDPLADEATELRNPLASLASADTITIEGSAHRPGPSKLLVGLSAAVALSAIGLFALLMTLFAGVLFTKQAPLQAAVPAPRPPIEAPAPRLPPTVVPTPVPELEIPEVPTPVPQLAPPAPPVPRAPRPPVRPRVRPTPRPPPPPAELPQLRVTGEARVTLTGGGTTYKVGDRIPPGDYRFLAEFPTGDHLRLALKVAPGEKSLVFSCDPNFRTCDRK